MEGMSAPAQVYVCGDIESLYACTECGRAFVPHVTRQKTCGRPECQRARNGRLTRQARGWSPARDTSPRPCVVCGATFEPSNSRHLTCGEACSKRRHYDTHRARPAFVERKRQISREWAVRAGRTHRSGAQPWLAGPPAYAQRLPGALLPVTISPMPRALLTLAGTTQLHGLLSGIFGDAGFPHEQAPPFALVASERGWCVYVAHDEMAAAVASWSVPRRCGRHLVEVRFGEPTTIPSPVVRGRGQRVLRVTAISPSLVRRSVWTDETRTKRSSVYYDRPSAENMRSALLRVGERLGLDREQIARTLRLELVADGAQRIEVVARELGPMRGWSGDVLVATNAVGEWLLRCAETVGLGGRVGFGFGRIGITTEDETPPRLRVALRAKRGATKR